MDSLEMLFDFDSALVFGIGGSGDIVGSIPTARLLEQQGLDILLGGIAWEPVPKDTRPGPRSFDEIDGLDRISETVGLASDETRTQDGLEFTETLVARHYDTDTALIDISQGVDAVRRGIDAAARQLDIDLVVGVDAGGDVLARGHDPGFRSPVTDVSNWSPSTTSKQPPVSVSSGTEATESSRLRNSQRDSRRLRAAMVYWVRGG